MIRTVLTLAIAAFILFPAKVSLAESPHTQGTEYVPLTPEMRRYLTQYVDLTTTQLNAAVAAAKGKSDAEALATLSSAIRKVVIDSSENDPRAELLVRYVLNQALEIAIGVPTWDGKAMEKPAILQGTVNPSVKKVILLDSIQLVLEYAEKDKALLGRSDSKLKELPYGEVAFDRLKLAREWLPSVLDPKTRNDYLLAVFWHWHTTVTQKDSSAYYKFAPEILRADSITQGTFLRPGLSLEAANRLLQDELDWMIQSLEEKETGPASQLSFCEIQPENCEYKVKIQSRYATGGAVQSTAVVLKDGNVAIGSDDSRIYFFDGDGNYLEEDRGYGQYRSRLVRNGDYAFALATNGKFGYHRVGSNPSEGYITAEMEAGPVITSRDGLLFAGRDGDIYLHEGNTTYLPLMTVGTRSTNTTVGGGMISVNSDLQTKGIAATPLVTSRGTTVIGTLDGFAYFLSSTWQQLARYRAGGGQFYSDPVQLLDGRVIMGAYGGTFHILDASGAKPSLLPGNPAKRASPLELNGGLLALPQNEAKVQFFNRESAKGGYSYQCCDLVTLGKPSSTPVRLDNGYMALATDAGYVYFVNPNVRSREVVGKIKIGTNITSSPVALPEGGLVIGSDDGSVYFLKLEFVPKEDL